MRSRRFGWSASWLDCVLVALLVGVASIGRFQNGYVMDDFRMIVSDETIHDPANLPLFFVRSAMEATAGGQQSEGLATYRPLALVSMTVSSMLGGKEPWPYHLTGLLLHLAVVVSIWWVVRRAAADDSTPPGYARWAAGVAALWFGLHPELCEAHVWINGRSDVLAALGLVWAAHWAMSWARQPDGGSVSPLFCSAGAFLFACFGKETALLALPALVLATWGMSPGRRVRRAAALGLALALPAAVFVMLRSAAVGEAAGTSMASGAGAMRAALQLGWYWVEALGHVVVPRATGMRVIGDEYATFPVGVFVLGWLLATGVAAWAAWQLPRRPVVSMGVIGFACVLAPVALITAGNWPGWGRYLYAPSALLAVGVVPAVTIRVLGQVSVGRAARTTALAIGAAMLVWFALGTGRAVRDYRDFEAFYSASARDWPGSSLGPAGLGELRHVAGRYSEATPYLEQALASAPASIGHLRNLAVNLVFVGRQRDAYVLALRGIELGAETESFHNIAGMAAAGFEPSLAARHWLACVETEVCSANLQRSVRSHPARDVFVQEIRAVEAPAGSRLEQLQRAADAAP